MKTTKGWFIVALFFISANAFADGGAVFRGGLDAGYNGGLGWFLHLDVANFSPEAALSARLGFGYSWRDAGDPAAARKIFINDATNGVPQESGGMWLFRFDVLFPLRLKSIPRARLYLGPRYARFTGNFDFVGGNEVFAIKSNPWGAGGGFESAVAISRKVMARFDLGIDYYFETKIYGHDTAYAPDGQNINPRKQYTYADAKQAINQPGIEWRLMLGVSYQLGR